MHFSNENIALPTIRSSKPKTLIKISPFSLSMFFPEALSMKLFLFSAATSNLAF